MSKPSKIVVFGGAGLVGTPIVRALRAAGWSVRVSSRKAEQARERLGPDVELMAGDAKRLEDVERAMAGCQAVLVCVSDLLDPYLDLRVTQNVVRLAPEMGIERIGLVSGASVAAQRRQYPMIDAKYQAEEYLKASDLPWIIFRLTWPMESLARFVEGNRAAILGKQPAIIHPVAGADIGRMVARAFELDEAPGHTFTIHGPTACTMKEWLDAYCAKAHPGVRVKHVPFWVVSMMATLQRDHALAAAVTLMRYFDRQPEYGDPAQANRMLGAPTLTLADWLASQPSRQPLAA